jgi:translation elongation factor P/translation initiation factor 5A
VDYIQITPGRRASIMQVEFKELNTGTKINERLRSEEKVESTFLLSLLAAVASPFPELSLALVVQLEDTDVEYSGTNDDGKLLFKDVKNMEDIEVDPAIITPAHLADYLRGMTEAAEGIESCD